MANFTNSKPPPYHHRVHKNVQKLLREKSAEAEGERVFPQILRLGFTACLRISAKRKIAERPSVDLAIISFFEGELAGIPRLMALWGNNVPARKIHKFRTRTRRVPKRKMLDLKNPSGPQEAYLI